MQTEREQADVREAASNVAPASATHDNDTRERAEDLAASADVLIDRILSGDSRAFLDANRQTGGE